MSSMFRLYDGKCILSKVLFVVNTCYFRLDI